MYNQSLDKKYNIQLRNLRQTDYADFEATYNATYQGQTGSVWTVENVEHLLAVFPEGQICIEVNDKVVAVALAIIINYSDYGDNHTYLEVTDNYELKTHNPYGDVLYGIDVFVHPDYQGMRLGRRLYDARKELCENLNLRAIIAGGRIPTYEKYADELTPKQYLRKVSEKQIYDPILTFQLSNDFHVKKVLRNYLPEDEQSKAFATLLEWNNVYYEEKEKLINARKSVVRIGLVQWQMRPVSDMDTLSNQIEFFIDAVSDYQSDFILFPEFFNAPLMANFNHQDEPDAIRSLASFTEPLRKKFIEFAISYNINIITGSMPYVEDGLLYNICYLCRRDGSFDSFKKIHITPSEADSWGMRGGNELKVFETDSGKIGILICYDVEFPELPRLYAEQGMEILFVPFLTDTQTGYNRIRRCAQARTIENECYVAIAGAVGNLPRVKNMGIQYAQSAVFSPSDFAFPTENIVAETTPNTEMTLIADVNLDLLKELHQQGSVRTMKDRRLDLYSVKWHQK